jgi:hypothetical protein
MRSHRHLMHTLAARGVLALVFLLAQHTATLHWLSHAIEATHATVSKVSAPAADHCDECLALSALGAAATSGGVTLPSGAAHHALASAPAPAPSPTALRLAFQSRAPPILG